MTSSDFEKSLLALAAWSAAKEHNTDPLAIAHAIRNRTLLGRSYSEVVAAIPLHHFPDTRDPAFFRLLESVDDIYDGTAPDFTGGACHWGGTCGQPIAIIGQTYFHA